jgi:glyoxylase-like metal-dependent hydrolase (beta-lactamase superfamily II)
MDEIFPNIFKLLPAKVMDSKYISFLVKRAAGNLLFPCFSNSSTIHNRFDAITDMGGLRYQLLGDSHFKTPHCDEVAVRFNAPLYCSELEAPDVTRKLKRVVVFPFKRHLLEPDIEIIPTPGHRPGGVCYRVQMGDKSYLFAGDTIWHDGQGWNVFPTKAGVKQMHASLLLLLDVEFDVLLANTRVDNAVCSVTLTPEARRVFLNDLIGRSL